MNVMRPQVALAFVPADSSARVRSPERRLIRRHCMQQKNKQPGSRRSKRETARAAAEHSSRPQTQRQTSSSRPPPVISTGQSTPNIQLPADVEQRHGLSEDKLPRAPPPDWALFHFAEELDGRSQKLMHQYFVRNPIRDPLCPFQLFGIQLDIDENPFWCFQLLVSDTLCFHAIILLASASNDLMQRQPLSKITYCHLHRTLPILNRRLSEAHAYKHDLVLYTVGILASIAVLFGDNDAAKAHAAGISKILRLRGLLGVVEQSPTIQLSIDRLNFSSMLLTRQWRPIDSGSLSEPSVLPAELTNLCHSQGMLCVDGLDSDLAAVFYDVQCITSLLNKHYYDQTPVDGVFLQQGLRSVHSRLIRLEGQVLDKLSECLCLATMAIFAATFRLPGLYEHPCFRSLAPRLQLAYAAAKVLHPELDERLDVWLFLVCLMAAEDIRQLWRWPVRTARVICGLSWEKTRSWLKQVMWIDTFHDDLGRRAFESFQAQSRH